MRLSLRNILAYLDDMLDPQNAQDLGTRIEESEVASGLVRRIRNSVQNTRVPAPKVEEQAAGADANTVAEYLDYTMDPEAIGEFEKKCLESDVRLAEVSSCNQLLALVLRQPAEIPDGLRERVYGVIERAPVRGAGESPDATAAPAAGATGVETEAGADSAESAASSTAAAGLAAAATTEPPAETDDETTYERRKKEVPDYLKEGTKLRVWPIILTVLLAVLLAGAVLMALNPPSGMFGGGPDDVAATGTPASPADSEQPANGANTNEPADAGPAADADTTDDEAETVEEGETDADSTAPADGASDATTDDGAVAPDDAEIAEGDTDETPPSPETTEGPGDDTTPATEEGASDADTATPPPPTEAARLLSVGEVLVVYDQDKNMWNRLAPRASVMSGSELVALPTFRPQLSMLANNVQLTVDGGSRLRLSPPTAEGAAVVTITDGRLVAAPGGRPDARLAIKTPHSAGVVVFSKDDAAAAIECRGYLPPGSDPLSQPHHTICQVYCVSGEIEFERGEVRQTLAVGQALEFVDDRDGVVLGFDKAPEWVAANTSSLIDQRAAETIREQLAPERPLGLTLHEMVEDRRSEIRSLAVRSLAAIGDYDPFVSVLNDPTQRSSWDEHVNAISRAIAQGPEEARRVHDALVKHAGGLAGEMFRLLAGYSPKQLEAGDAARLVAYLEHDELALRVLAIENLFRITGATKTYRPEVSEASRRTPVRLWKERAEAGDIVYRTPPRSLSGIE